MEKITERILKIEGFFDAYVKRFNDALHDKAVKVEEVTGSFAESFIEASPKGIISGKNDSEFKKAIPKGYEFYRSIGTQNMEILSKNITILDDMHILVQIGWKSHYEKQDGTRTSIEFDVFYLLQDKNGNLKIFAYITGDEQKALEDKGLKPYKN